MHRVSHKNFSTLFCVLSLH